MGILTLGAGLGSTITVFASGAEAQEALDALAELVANRSARTSEGRERLHPEVFAEIETPDVGMGDDRLRRPLGQHMAAVDDVGAVDQARASRARCDR